MKKRTVIIISVLTIAALLIVGYLMYLKYKPAGKENGAELAAFETPEGFDWEGVYLDKTEGYAVLTIEKAGDEYSCSVAIPSEDVSYINSYTFGAVLSDNKLWLEYQNGKHTTYLIPPADSDQEVSTDEVYSDGTGQLYYVDGYINWLDEKDYAGNNLLFEKKETEGESEDTNGGQ